jgi:hypothetical protein
MDLAAFACSAWLCYGELRPVEVVPMCLTTNKHSLTRVLQNYGAATKLSLAKAGNLPHMRTLLSVWSDGLAPLPEALVSIDATSCTKTSSGLDARGGIHRAWCRECSSTQIGTPLQSFSHRHGLYIYQSRFIA